MNNFSPEAFEGSGAVHLSRETLTSHLWQTTKSSTSIWEPNYLQNLSTSILNYANHQSPVRRLLARRRRRRRRRRWQLDWFKTRTPHTQDVGKNGMYVCVCIHTCTVCMYVCMYVCRRSCIYVYMYACMRVQHVIVSKYAHHVYR